MEKVRIELEENNDTKVSFYELRTRIIFGRNQERSIPYAKSDDSIVKKIAEDVSRILESRGYFKKDVFIGVDSRNLFSKTGRLLNPFLPNLLKENLEKLNYKVNVNQKWENE